MASLKLPIRKRLVDKVTEKISKPRLTIKELDAYLSNSNTSYYATIEGNITNMGCTSYCLRGVRKCHGITDSKQLDLIFWNWLRDIYEKNTKQYLIFWSDRVPSVENPKDLSGGKKFAMWLRDKDIGTVTISKRGLTSRHGSWMQGFIWSPPQDSTFEQLWKEHNKS